MEGRRAGGAAGVPGGRQPLALLFPQIGPGRPDVPVNRNPVTITFIMLNILILGHMSYGF